MESSGTDKELRALINLIDEPDEVIYRQIRDRILSYGMAAIPFLEEAWGNNLEPEAQRRIEILTHKIHFEHICTELNNWYTLGGGNLLTAYILVSKYHYPDMNDSKIKDELERIKKDVWIELNLGLTSFEKIGVINRIMFEELKFEGNRTNFHAPQNHYINQVLETRIGSALSLSVIYMLIANMVGLPVYGVNLPDNFVLAYMDETVLIHGKSLDEADVLFYINPFNKGMLFTRKEIDIFLTQKKIEPDEKYYRPCSNIDIIIKLLQSLAYSYEQTGNKIKVSEIEILLGIFK